MMAKSMKTLESHYPMVPFLINTLYYMVLSLKDWELPNSRIGLAEIDIESGRVHRPNAVRSVLTTSVKILPYKLTKLS